MVLTDSIKRAQETIGAGKDNDYVIAPTAHTEEFKAKAPALAAVLSSSAVSVAARGYEERDQDANVSQNDFKRVFNSNIGNGSANRLRQRMPLPGCRTP